MPKSRVLRGFPQPDDRRRGSLKEVSHVHKVTDGVSIVRPRRVYSAAGHISTATNGYLPQRG